MFISIVTINLNNEQGLVDTIKSIESQDSDAYEWIFIDGQSSDESVSLAKQSKIKKKIIISEQDAGIYHAMNKGIAQASGDYIIFMNSGDFFNSPQIISQFILEAMLDKADVFYGDTIEVGKKKNRVHKSHSPALLKRGMFCHHQSLFYKRTDDIIYNQQYKFAADYELTVRLFSKNKIFRSLNFVVSRFKFGGVSTQSSRLSFREMVEIRENYFGVKSNYIEFVLNQIKVFLKSCLLE